MRIFVGVIGFSVGILAAVLVASCHLLLFPQDPAAGKLGLNKAPVAADCIAIMVLVGFGVSALIMERFGRPADAAEIKSVIAELAPVTCFAAASMLVALRVDMYLERQAVSVYDNVLLFIGSVLLISNGRKIWLIGRDRARSAERKR